MKKILNVKTAIVCLILSLVFEILTFCLQIVNSSPNYLLTFAIIFVVGFYLYLLNRIKNTSISSKYSVYAFFLFYITLAQLIYELFPYDVVGICLTIPAVVLVIAALRFFLKPNNKKK